MQIRLYSYGAFLCLLMGNMLGMSSAGVGQQTQRPPSVLMQSNGALVPIVTIPCKTFLNQLIERGFLYIQTYEMGLMPQGGSLELSVHERKCLDEFLYRFMAIVSDEESYRAKCVQQKGGNTIPSSAEAIPAKAKRDMCRLWVQEKKIPRTLAEVYSSNIMFFNVMRYFLVVRRCADTQNFTTSEERSEYINEKLLQHVQVCMSVQKAFPNCSSYIIEAIVTRYLTLQVLVSSTQNLNAQIFKELAIAFISQIPVEARSQISQYFAQQRVENIAACQRIYDNQFRMYVQTNWWRITSTPFRGAALTHCPTESLASAG